MTPPAPPADGDAAADAAAAVAPVVGARRRMPPTVTRAVFTDLSLWTVGFGVLTGAVFPWFVVCLGVDAADALTARFFAATLLAGVLVGGVNWWLARLVVGARLRVLSGGMQRVASGVRRATDTGDWSGCEQQDCRLPVDSDDEIGDSAQAFNELVSALSRSQRVEAAVRDLLQTLSVHLELDELTQAALTAVAGHVGASCGALLLWRGDSLHLSAATDPAVAGALPDAGALQAVLSSGGTRALDGPSGVVLAVPVLFAEQPLAVLVLAGPEVSSTENSRILELFAGAVAVSLVNALTHARAQELAQLDPLTGCANRRSGLVRLDEALSATDATGLPAAVGVLMIDLDHFKAVNDTYGHLAGDRVLASTAAAVQACLRSSDTLVRYGGEEFLAVLPGAGEVALTEVARRICAALQDAPVQTGPRGQTVTVTASVGGAARGPTSTATPEQLVELADRALYRAKAAGRNRVVSAATLLEHGAGTRAPAVGG